MKRLNAKRIKELTKEYKQEFKDFWEWKTEQAIAYELAKDFIFNAHLEFDAYLDKHYKEYWGEIFRKRADLRIDALKETVEYYSYDF